jgi:hypothetical protein
MTPILRVVSRKVPECLINAAQTGKVDFGICGGEFPLFKRRMIGRELPREFFAEGRIPDEFLKFADVNAP